MREALRQGIELFKNREFEKAAPFFGIAQAGQQTLAPPELQDLATFSAQNAIALKSRQEGAAQLQQAELALKQGRAQEAGQFLNALNGNQFLTPAQRQQVTDLSRSVPGDANPKAPSAKDKDAKALLAAGREALKAGDFARAEALADQAEKATAASWLPTWPGENAAKLRRDIQAARAKQQQPADSKAAADKGCSRVVEHRRPARQGGETADAARRAGEEGTHFRRAHRSHGGAADAQ